MAEVIDLATARRRAVERKIDDAIEGVEHPDGLVRIEFFVLGETVVSVVRCPGLSIDFVRDRLEAIVSDMWARRTGVVRDGHVTILSHEGTDDDDDFVF